MAYERCLSEIKRAAGIDFTDRELERILEDIIARARASKSPRLSEPETLAAAARALGAEAKAAAAIERRNAALNLAKRVARRSFYQDAPNLVQGIEAKLAGVNASFFGSRASVDNAAKTLIRDYTVGLAADLEHGGLFETFRRGGLDLKWATELAELNKPDGKAGITGDRTALEIARTVQKYQRLAVDDLNRAGAWIGDYAGYVSRQSHDPDRIRRATYEVWRREIMPRLDPRTFEGVSDPERFLQNTYNALVTGVHMTIDGLQGFKDPAFTGPGNLAKRLSQERVLHFKDAQAWLEYHRQFSRGTLAESVLTTLTHSARSTALMREFGTNPRAELDADLRFLAERFRNQPEVVNRLRAREKAIHNLFAELDGTASMPVNRLGARIAAGTRAIENMAKLGGVLISSMTDVPFKAAELRYQGIGLLQAYWDGLTSLVRGRGRGAEREIMDLLRAGAEGMQGEIVRRFDAADTVPGRLSKIQNTFFKFAGLTYWTDAQRAGAELLMSRHLGKMQKLGFEALPEPSRRILEAFGIDAGRWDLLRGVAWQQANGRAYLTPDAAERIPAARLEAYLREAGLVAPKAKPEAVAAKIADFRRELGLQLASYFTDRGEFAVLNPGARERAILRRGTRPGTVEGEALRLIAQFKTFPVAVITKAFGRDLYGGQGGFGATAGIVHMMVASTVLGYVAMSAKDLAKGRTPRDPNDPKTWLAAFAQGGALGIYGDFITGDYSRYGRSLASTMLGPTLGQIDDVAELWSRVKQGNDVAAQTLRMLLNNTPFVNLFYTRIALDYLVLYQVQEALNPGYLRRWERRVQQQNHQTFLISPSRAIPYGGGNRLFEGVRP